MATAVKGANNVDFDCMGTLLLHFLRVDSKKSCTFAAESNQMYDKLEASAWDCS